MIGPISTRDRKYTFSIPKGDYRVHVLRYGEPWLVIESGSKAIAELLYEIEERREAEADGRKHGEP